MAVISGSFCPITRATWSSSPVRQKAQYVSMVFQVPFMI
jgi:hypothetical protein